ERASEYLFSARMLEEKIKRSAEDSVQESAPPEVSTHDEELQSEIEDLLGGGSPAEEEENYGDEEETSIRLSSQTEISEIDEDLGELEKQFNLSTGKNRDAKKARADHKEEIKTPLPQLRTKGGNEFVGSITSLMEEATNSEDLLSGLLQRLVDGPFEKTALIVISKDRKHAIVVAARGPIGNGQKIEINDPLSPLAQCFAKVQSFSSKPNEASPFGSKSFAVAPINADHDTPVALYADCGKDGAITFEARRIFRTVVDILNEKLPTLPGGIPVELDS
ncbi:MAG: hypothetical protein KDD60_12270, partial [Bdellovibrionales bacterium]|nr:hypothetical protein [Bdellovibrionales bacterium]